MYAESVFIDGGIAVNNWNLMIWVGSRSLTIYSDY